MAINKVGMQLPQPPSFERQSQPTSQTTPKPSQTFGQVLENAVNSTVEAQQTAEQLSTAVAQGEDVPMNKVIESVSAAEIKLETLVTVRDRAVQAYQQLTQMPI